jgi:hypothetical protein
MMSRPVAVALLAAGCLTAAGGGAYIAVRHNATAAQVVEPVALAAPASTPTVSETEAVIEPTVKEDAAKPAPIEPERPAAPAARPHTTPRRSTPAATRAVSTAPREAVAPPVADHAVPPAPSAAAEVQLSGPAAPATMPTATAATAPPVEDPPAKVETPAAPELEEITVPAASVIGLEVETPLTSEKARVEDRVDARVTRDVYADGKLAIPAGTRMIGAVTEVERGGKVKERARLGVRFHTLVLTDGRRIDVRTDTIFREGQSPTGESSRKIGGAAVGGAVLGAIMGGGKGAMIGGAAGAAGGTAAVMAGGRNAATIASGTVLNARLAAPVTVEVERR